MTGNRNAILLLGESGVGKTHYGAQLLQRLRNRDGQLRMDGAAPNLAPFEAAMNRLNEGKAADHTPTSTYDDSVWPITDAGGGKAVLVWPDYGGEQIRNMSSSRRIPAAWRARVQSAPAWLLLVRLQKIRVGDDIFSRPLQALQGAGADNREVEISDQARLIELLQMLLYIRGALSPEPLHTPRLCVLLSCWDELGTNDPPAAVLRQRLPLFESFISSLWAKAEVLGLSALGRPLSLDEGDEEYMANGPEKFGYVVLPDGEHSLDLTLPIRRLLVKEA